MKHLVVLTGAGVSAESGLTTFGDNHGLGIKVNVGNGHQLMATARTEYGTDLLLGTEEELGLGCKSGYGPTIFF